MLNADNVVNLSPAAFTVAVVVLLGLEHLSPLTALLAPAERARHALRNFGIALFAGVVAVAGGVALVQVATECQARGWGLLNVFDAPWPVRFAVSLVGIDLFEYVRHRAHHRVPLLWRLHRVHHSDPHVDSTTSIRGHPLETVVAYAYFSLVVALLGADALSLAVRTFISVVALAWHHSAWKLPFRLDATIALVTPTPRTHRVHHSRDVRFTDSNFGTLFTWWDRLFGTFTPGHELQPDKPTGLDGFDAPQAQSVWGVLRSPFKA